jgi:hypothetical protein
VDWAEDTEGTTHCTIIFFAAFTSSMVASYEGGVISRLREFAAALTRIAGLP